MSNVNVKDRDKDIHLKEYYDVDGEQEYRYLLSRYWDDANKIVTVIMCNPSDASYLYEDKTVMNVNNFFIKKGYNKINIVNLFAYKDKNRDGLKNMNKKYEEVNNGYIKEAVDEAQRVVVAWGYGKENLDNWKNEDLKNIAKCQIEKVKCMLRSSGKEIKCFTVKDKEKNLHPRDLNLETWYLTKYF